MACLDPFLFPLLIVIFGYGRIKVAANVFLYMCNGAKMAGWIKRVTGRSLNIVFFFKILKYIPYSGLSRFPLGVSVCTQ